MAPPAKAGTTVEALPEQVGLVSMSGWQNILHETVNLAGIFVLLSCSWHCLSCFIFSSRMFVYHGTCLNDSVILHTCKTYQNPIGKKKYYSKLFHIWYFNLYAYFSLVGDLEPFSIFFIFPYIGNIHFHILGIFIPIGELLFFRGVGQPPTISIVYP